MTRSTFTLAALAAVLVAAAGCRGTRSEDPPVHLIKNMDSQPKGEPQDPNPFWIDNRAMRKPPEGTVAVGHLQEDGHFYRGVGLDGKLVDELPQQLALNEAFLERGRERYEIYCAPCHAETGYGNGPAVRRGGFTVEPANLHMRKLYPAPLGYFFHVISRGKGQMRPYAAQISVEDRWAIAAWVRVLQASHQASRDQIPARAIGQAQGGAQ